MNLLSFFHVRSTMRTNLLKLLDLLIFCKYSLNFNCFRLKFSNFVTNQLNISKFLPPQIRKTIIETKLHQFSKFLLIVFNNAPSKYFYTIVALARKKRGRKHLLFSLSRENVIAREICHRIKR